MSRPVSPAKRPVADSTRMRGQSFGARAFDRQFAFHLG
jgi:hypothetical protein